MKRLVDAYEKKSESSKNPATSPMVDHVREEIAQLLDIVIQSKAALGSDEHYYASQLLIKRSTVTCLSPSKHQPEDLHGLRGHGRTGRRIRLPLSFTYYVSFVFCNQN
jgi:hypothetical protein